MIHGGCSRRTRLLEDQLVLALEIGKSPTEVTRARHVPESRPSAAIFEFDSPPIPSWSLHPCASRDGRQRGEQDQGASARPALGACATRPGHAVNMLTKERLCKQHPLAQQAALVQLHGSARHCRLLCQSLGALESCVPLAPSHSRTVAGRCPNMCELVWAEPGKFVTKKGSEKTPPSERFRCPRSRL